MRHVQLKSSFVDVTISKFSSISFCSTLFLWWLNLKFLWVAAESLLPWKLSKQSVGRPEQNLVYCGIFYSKFSATATYKMNNTSSLKTLISEMHLTSRCQYDYVEVYDGPPHSSPLLGRLCSGSFPTYISSSNMMTVRFHSDSRYTFRGFQAHYSSIPEDHNTSKFLVGVSQWTSLFIAFV
uniref:CUB domain-containing protein n=1 Tax=Bubo bubo TaxID=30461 RepID=A0A8C0ER08_BUBBB